MHQFRALILFATKDYSQAAAALYAVLSAGPGWDWTTLSGMYASSVTYTDQLHELEEFVEKHPNSVSERFVLAYHYLTCCYNDAAVRQYQKITKLRPGDQLTAQLLKLLDSDTSADADTTQKPPVPDDIEDAPVAPLPIDATKVIGKWSAKRSDGVKFSINLTPDEKFTWGYDQADKHREFGGSYSIDGAVLVLERADGAQMPGLVTLADEGFNFKLYGGNPDDPGLNFKP